MVYSKANTELAYQNWLVYYNNNYRYLDDILTVNADFPTSGKQAYLQELTFNKANITRDSCQYVDLDISLVQGCFNVRVYDKRDDFSFAIGNFSVLDGDVPSPQSYGVISQLVGFARICSNVSDFSMTETRNNEKKTKIPRTALT